MNKVYIIHNILLICIYAWLNRLDVLNEAVLCRAVAWHQGRCFGTGVFLFDLYYCSFRNNLWHPPLCTSKNVSKVDWPTCPTCTASYRMYNFISTSTSALFPIYFVSKLFWYYQLFTSVVRLGLFCGRRYRDRKRSHIAAAAQRGQYRYSHFTAIAIVIVTVIAIAVMSCHPLTAVWGWWQPQTYHFTTVYRVVYQYTAMYRYTVPHTVILRSIYFNAPVALF